MLQRLWLCRASDTVFRREIDSQRQWGYGTCYGDSFPAAKECKATSADLVKCKVNVMQYNVAAPNQTICCYVLYFEFVFLFFKCQSENVNQAFTNMLSFIRIYQT